MERDQREALLEAGMRIVQTQGFGATGVRDIAAAAGVPQGSFTNHFRSKDRFGALVLDRYAAKLDAIMRETLDDETRPAAERLRAYFGRIAATLIETEYRRGCMVPDLAAEISNHSDALRERLAEIITEQSGRFEAVVRQSTPGGMDPADFAGFLLAAWHGTLLRMKVERSAAAVERFRRTLETLMPSPP